MSASILAYSRRPLKTPEPRTLSVIVFRYLSREVLLTLTAVPVAAVHGTVDGAHERSRANLRDESGGRRRCSRRWLRGVASTYDEWGSPTTVVRCPRGTSAAPAVGFLRGSCLLARGVR